MLKMIVGWGLLAVIALAVFRLTGSCRGNRCGRCCSGRRECGKCHMRKFARRGGKK